MDTERIKLKATEDLALGGVKQLTVVFSRRPPEEKAHEYKQTQLMQALSASGIAFRMVDSLYDMQPDEAGVAYLRSIEGELLVLGWQYPRAIKWILARHGLEVNDTVRKLHCIDVRDEKVEALIEKLMKIRTQEADAIVHPRPKAKGTRPGTHPQVETSLSAQERGALAETELAPPENAALSPRWYPVIDYDQCVNCMECIDFCLFGVYGVDHQGTLRVSQQDQCRQDCPACSRVCPVGAIFFPKYQTNQTIAGADEAGDRGSMKLDLSKIFGKPKARHTAALERDRELIKAGRRPVGADRVDALAEAIDQLEI